METVREIMSREPETVDPQSTVQELARLMADLNIGAVPVVEGGELRGMVTDRDIALRVVALDLVSSDVRTSDVFTPGAITATADMSTADAARVMAEHQVRRLPVVDGRRLVGIVSLGDISVEGDSAAAGQALKEISEQGT